MHKINIVKTKEKLKELFNFFSNTFYEEAIENNEHYFTMSERFEEMKQQFEQDKDFLMYITDNNKIIAGITGKRMDLEKEKITIGILAVDKNYRRKGIAKQLVNEFEDRCKSKNIKHIDLGARFRACPLYLNLYYDYKLMIQVFDFATIEEVRNANKYNFEEIFSWQGETYGFIFYKVDKITEEYISYFEKNVKTANVQYIFNKDLVQK